MDTILLIFLILITTIFKLFSHSWTTCFPQLTATFVYHGLFSLMLPIWLTGLARGCDSLSHVQGKDYVDSRSIWAASSRATRVLHQASLSTGKFTGNSVYMTWGYWLTCWGVCIVEAPQLSGCTGLLFCAQGTKGSGAQQYCLAQGSIQIFN